MRIGEEWTANRAEQGKKADESTFMLAQGQRHVLNHGVSSIIILSHLGNDFRA